MQIGSLKNTTAGLVCNARRCLKAHHNASQCSLCIDACPHSALRRSERLPELVSSLCTQCGACAAACPTDALHIAGLREPSKPVPEHTVRIACSQAQTKTPFKAVCFQELKTAELVAFALDRSPVTLAAGPCSECSRKCPARDIEKTVEAANEVITQAGGAPVTLERCPLKVDLGRRKLFSGLFGEEKPAQEVKPPAFYEETNEAFKRVPDSHALALGLLEHIENADTQSLGLTAQLPSFDADKCAACPLCVTACPSGALAVRRENDALVISLVPAACIGCGLCAEVCYRGAVQMKPAQKEKLFSEVRGDVLTAVPADEIAASTLEKRTREIFDAPVYDT